jgi:hypothetical protein
MYLLAALPRPLAARAESDGYGQGRYPYHGFRGERDYMPKLHDLTRYKEPEWLSYANGLALEPSQAFDDLLKAARALLTRLANPN